MATNMAPHNLSEAVDAICAYIDNREITIDELMKHIIAPDFPTGGIIYGYEGVEMLSIQEEEELFFVLK